MDNKRTRLMINKSRPFILAFILISMAAIVVAEVKTKDLFARWNCDMDKFAMRDANKFPPENAILFVGSSSIRMWRTKRFFPDFVVINRGFGGSKIPDSTHFADRIITPYKPKIIVFYAGDNDIAGRTPPEKVFENYKKFIRKIRESLPDVPVIYMAIKGCKARWKFIDNVHLANALIETEINSDPNQFFINTEKQMLGEDGLPIDKLYRKDRLHMTDAGYKIWKAALMPYLNYLSQPASERGTFAGEVFLGDGLKCLLFKKADNLWNALAWSQEGQKPIPAELQSSNAVKSNGKTGCNDKITPEGTVFTFDKLPPLLEIKRNVKLITPSVIILTPGQTSAVNVYSKTDISLFCENLPEGISFKQLRSKDPGTLGRIEISKELPAGKYIVELVAKCKERIVGKWQIELQVVSVTAKTPKE